MVWINGEVQDRLAVSDRAVQFGDGCFTTARVRDGEVDWLADHLQRLQLGARRLLIEGVDWLALEAEIKAAAAGQGDGVLKAVITRGSGGRGYSAAGCSTPTRIVSFAPYPSHYHRLRESGARLALSPVRLGLNPLLAGIKHLNRLEQVLIRTQLEQTGADEALVLDTAGKLVECCAANLFWRIDQQVFTPLLTHSGVDGIMRQRIISLLEQKGYHCQEVSVEMSVLSRADEVLICNALMPVLPVYQVEEWRYASRQLFDLISPHC
ncbi:aminodeoxychorismate lyase [Erwiniaceae bacterium BAC15a-03b]|uniref:Aminodeoxychorismate lyase n=1 Tax=Winslowiella arboricola TaxID=2978220 RepID=A0A9J6PXH0_9GAMM|nr:aminodeoxychorismate lyase [Winslowiella arboricola]MCU5775427.1 aminodeoxychorismate lyase [Winslowiella arboricola]MCU5780176.1 aminodeoxychorismate lyase [Winslowiella arboricola]